MVVLEGKYNENDSKFMLFESEIMKSKHLGTKQCDFIIQLLSEAVLTVRTVLLLCLVLGSQVMIQGHQKRASDIPALESQAAVSCLMFALRPKLHFLLYAE